MPTVIIEDSQGHRKTFLVHTKQALMVEEVCKPPYNQLLEIGIAWATMQVTFRGGDVTSKIEIGVK